MKNIKNIKNIIATVIVAVIATVIGGLILNAIIGYPSLPETTETTHGNNKPYTAETDSIINAIISAAGSLGTIEIIIIENSESRETRIKITPESNPVISSLRPVVTLGVTTGKNVYGNVISVSLVMNYSPVSDKIVYDTDTTTESMSGHIGSGGTLGPTTNINPAANVPEYQPELETTDNTNGEAQQTDNQNVPRPELPNNSESESSQEEDSLLVPAPQPESLDNFDGIPVDTEEIILDTETPLEFTYIVKFVDYDGTVLKDDCIPPGSTAIAPEDPYRTGWSFIGWDKDFNDVNQDITITAEYIDIEAFYKVRFVSHDGTLLAIVEDVPYGGSAKAPEDPAREGFIFIGWDKKLNNVTQDMTITAQYEYITPYVTIDNPETPTTPTLDEDDVPLAEVSSDDVPLAEEPSNAFTDVRNRDWFYDDVLYVTSNGYMNGTSAEMFGPNQTLTRAMVVTILYRIAGSPTVISGSKFTDVPVAQWYSEAVSWGVDNGLVKGYGNELFGTFANITRQDMSAIVHRYANATGLDSESAYNSVYNGFIDEENISDYAAKPVEWCVENGIINGKPGGYFGPQGNTTRAEFAAILHRFVTSSQQDKDTSLMTNFSTQLWTESTDEFNGITDYSNNETIPVVEDTGIIDQDTTLESTYVPGSAATAPKGADRSSIEEDTAQYEYYPVDKLEDSLVESPVDLTNTEILDEIEIIVGETPLDEYPMSVFNDDISDDNPIWNNPMDNISDKVLNGAIETINILFDQSTYIFDQPTPLGVPSYIDPFVKYQLLTFCLVIVAFALYLKKRDKK